MATNIDSLLNYMKDEGFGHLLKNKNFAKLVNPKKKFKDNELNAISTLNTKYAKRAKPEHNLFKK